MIWYYLIIVILLAVFLGLVVFMFSTLLYILPMVKGAVYVPSKPEAIATMLEFARRKKKTSLIADLGSGDGRVVTAFAQAGFTVHGYEINPLLIWRARRLIHQKKLQEQAHIIGESYWDFDLGNYDVIVVYGITYIMADLAKKLRSELKPGTLVISNYFELPGWKKLQTTNGIHLYQR